MDADGVPIVGQSLDLKLIEPLQHKRTLAYINHFIIQVHFLSYFRHLFHASFTFFLLHCNGVYANRDLLEKILPNENIS